MFYYIVFNILEIHVSVQAISVRSLTAHLRIYSAIYVNMAMSFFWLLNERLRPILLYVLNEICLIGIKRTIISELNGQ